MHRRKGKGKRSSTSISRCSWARGARAVTAVVLAAAALSACGDNTEPLPLLPANGPSPQALPIRRLTNAEYLASVTDLFPGIKLPDLTFVPDTKILGFSNLSSSQTSSLVRMEQYESAAQAIAGAVTADPTTLTGCDVANASETSCAEPYLRDLAKRAYRRPLTDSEVLALQQLFAANTGVVDYQARLALAIEGVLLSPKFLFRPEVGTTGEVPDHKVRPLTSHEVATRLSYLINGSIPDATLMAAADADGLRSVEGIRNQAKRLLTLPASQARLVNFHELWLGIDTILSSTVGSEAWNSRDLKSRPH